jgi:hypothetical protein
MKTLEIIPFEEYDDSLKTIVPSSTKIPEWYKNIKPTVEGIKTFLLSRKPSDTNSTIKRCVPFLDAMSNGYMVTLSCDVEVAKHEDGSPMMMWRVNKEIITTHDKSSWDGLKIGTEFHQEAFKWNNGLSFKTPNDYSCLFTHPINRTDLPFFTISGLVDTDTYPLPTQFPFFLKKDFTGIIEAGTPIAQIILIKRDNWNHKINKYDGEYSRKKYSIFFSKIIRSYKNQFWHKKIYQ